MRFVRPIIGAAAALCVFNASASAETIDQQQPFINASAGFLGVGGDSEQQLAQTFEVGVSGRLIALDLPMTCSGEAPVIEVRRQAGGQPTGTVLRAITPSIGDIPASYGGFQRLYLPAPLVVSTGDALAFTVKQSGDGNCSYATSPPGDHYLRGSGFFDARPNPPGWIAFKHVLDPWDDLPFRTVMEDAADRRADRCVIPDLIDPATGEPLELPISRFVPACRCFEDSAAREFRCGVLHPDFVLLRRIPWPLKPGAPFKEVWEFTPVTPLDGPVSVRLTGAGHHKPISRVFGKNSKPGETEVTAIKVNPGFAKELPGVAAISYPMEDAKNEHLKFFGLDISIGSEDFQ